MRQIILDAARASDLTLRDDDILIVTHKVVSKAEGRLVDLRDVQPSDLARRFAEQWGKDARQVEVVLRESARIVRMDRGIIISQTRHGFVCANAGVDASNVAGEEIVCLLPVDPDASAAALREAIQREIGARVLQSSSPTRSGGPGARASSTSPSASLASSRWSTIAASRTTMGG